jgi:hypothetical protein
VIIQEDQKSEFDSFSEKSETLHLNEGFSASAIQSEFDVDSEDCVGYWWTFYFN